VPLKSGCVGACPRTDEIATALNMSAVAIRETVLTNKVRSSC
jgi:hypothetical protein